MLLGASGASEGSCDWRVPSLSEPGARCLGITVMSCETAAAMLVMSHIKCIRAQPLRTDFRSTAWPESGTRWAALLKINPTKLMLADVSSQDPPHTPALSGFVLLRVCGYFPLPEPTSHFPNKYRSLSAVERHGKNMTRRNYLGSKLCGDTWLTSLHPWTHGRHVAPLRFAAHGNCSVCWRSYGASPGEGSKTRICWCYCMIEQ